MYRPTNAIVKGSARLQTNGEDYLCPKCGGYGYIADSWRLLYGTEDCNYCNGKGTIEINDSRVIKIKS